MARVSRTTAYRYFPSQRALLAATFPQLEGGSLASARLERLILAIAAATGIEGFVWLADVGGVDRATAAAILGSTCSALLEHELHERVGSR